MIIIRHFISSIKIGSRHKLLQIIIKQIVQPNKSKIKTRKWKI